MFDLRKFVAGNKNLQVLFYSIPLNTICFGIKLMLQEAIAATQLKYLYLDASLQIMDHWNRYCWSVPKSKICVSGVNSSPIILLIRHRQKIGV
jgi:hypothetical protein